MNKDEGQSGALSLKGDQSGAEVYPQMLGPPLAVSLVLAQAAGLHGPRKTPTPQHTPLSSEMIWTSS